MVQECDPGTVIIYYFDQLAQTDQALRLYFTAVACLHVAYKITETSLTDETLDVLAAVTYLQLNDVRRCLNARQSSVLSLSQAAVLMKVIANNSRSTVQLIEIELSKAYLHRALRCEDSESGSVYCLAHVYLSVLYYITGQHQTSIDHCALVTKLQDHSQCSSYVVQELLPRIDDQVDNVLGVAVFYEYIRAAALNEEQGRRCVSFFTTELFAHYLLIKFLSLKKHRQLQQTPLAETRRYRHCLSNSPEIYSTDMMLFGFTSHAKYPPNDRLVTVDNRGESKSVIFYHQFDTSKLVELLQQSAVEHFTTCRELEARYFDHFRTADLKALYAYKCGQYQRCLLMSLDTARTTIFRLSLTVLVVMYPELIQLMDDDIVSLFGLTMLVNQSSVPPPPSVAVFQLSLSLYLIAQCQIKLRHSVTSLSTTLDYVQLARSYYAQALEYVSDCCGLQLHDMSVCRPLDQQVLKLVEQKIFKYICHYQ